MVQVHLHLQVGRIDGLHDRMRVVLAVQDIAGDVARIDGFDQHRDARRTGLARGPVQVLAVAIQQGLARHVGRRQARHHVDIRAGQRRRAASPRSPWPTTPGGALNSTCDTPAASMRSRTKAAGASYGNMHSTPRKPSAAAAA
ncbi:hypothetical protein G6F57_019452 [Rhizopus arrhizus]|nr:hypothetical protein G6F57_019452 [Rhizopus arrhizus]